MKFLKKKTKNIRFKDFYGWNFLRSYSTPKMSLRGLWRIKDIKKHFLGVSFRKIFCENKTQMVLNDWQKSSKDRGVSKLIEGRYKNWQTAVYRGREPSEIENAWKAFYWLKTLKSSSMDKRLAEGLLGTIRSIMDSCSIGFGKITIYGVENPQKIKDAQKAFYRLKTL